MLKYSSLYIPLLILAVSFALSPYVDIRMENLFFNPETKHFTFNHLTAFIFKRGIHPAQLVGICSLVVFGLSYLIKSWKQWRKPALMLILTMGIGAGFITHTLLKDHWGRPRPRQIIEFGGNQAFRTPYQPNFFHQPEPSKSFPSGHCTMGFFFFSFYFLGKRYERPWISYLGLFLAIVLGTALAFTRMAQGGHFLTDTIAAGVIMWLTAYVCDWMLYGEEKNP